MSIQNGLLVLSRKDDEEIVMIVPPSDRPQVISIINVGRHRDATRIGVRADKTIKVHRREILDKIARGEVKDIPNSKESHKLIGGLSVGQIVRPGR
jgi:sRNA-binding carbon storage regulator CsrA